MSNCVCRLEEASQLVVQCLTLEHDGTSIVLRRDARNSRLPSIEECRIIDISSSR